MTTGILGQSDPALDELTDLYTAPSNVSTTGRVFVTNRAAAATFRIAVAVAGADDSDEQYIAYDTAIGANENIATIAFFMGSTDVVRVESSTNDLSFTFTGTEVENGS